MIAAALAALLLAAPAASPPAGLQPGLPAPAAPAGATDLSPRPPGASHAGGETRCASCHTAEGWKKVSFSHDKTGFPLTGRHRDVSCAACHAGGDFGKPVARACAACHRDVHARRLGQRCDRCHDTAAFQQASFGPDAHRRTAFPLTGRHASLPCEECHGDRRDRTFSRPVARCVNCHQKDFDRTGADPGLLDHAAAGFSTDCRGCHGAWRFRPGTFPAHDACFAIRGGPHAGIACRDCHLDRIPPYVAGQALTCNPIPAGALPADCISCHKNTAAGHQGVAGYTASNPRCYECHRFAVGFPRLNRRSP